MQRLIGPTPLTWLAGLAIAATLVQQRPVVESSSGPQEPPAPAPRDAESPSQDDQDFAARLASDAHFKKLVFAIERGDAPVSIFVQRLARPDPDYERRVADFFGPWIAPMAAQFETRIATPAALPPGKDPRPIRWIVLATEGDFVNYRGSLKSLDGVDLHSAYDERLRAVVCYFERKEADHLRRASALRSFVVALLHQRSTAFGGRQPPMWLREGISAALAWHVGSDPRTALGVETIVPDRLRFLIELSQDVDRQNRLLLPIEELVAVVSLQDLWSRIVARASSQAQAEAQDAWYWAYHCQALTWVHFLTREDAGPLRVAFDEYLRAGMRGGGSPGDFRQAFGAFDLRKLDLDCLRWSYARARDAGIAQPDEARLATQFETHPTTNATEAPRPLRERLDLPRTPAVIHALALRRALAGAVQGALDDLKTALETRGDDPACADLREEVERLEGWRAARDAWAAGLAASGGRVNLTRDGKKIVAKVVRFESGVLSLAIGKTSETLAIEAIPTDAIVGQMKANPEGAPDWARAYGLLIANDPRWEKLLRDTGPIAEAIRADGRKRYDALDALGLVAQRLVALAERAPNAGPAALDLDAALALLSEIEALIRDCAEAPLVVERKGALRELAQHAAGVVHDASPQTPALFGTINDEGERDTGTFSVRYEFDARSEADDWPSQPKLANAIQGHLDRNELARAPEFDLAAGALSARGSFLFLHPIPLEAPLGITVRMRWGTADKESTGLGYFSFGVVDDAAQSLARAWGDATLDSRDPRSGKHEYRLSELAQGVELGAVHEFEMSLDAGKLRLRHPWGSEPPLAIGSVTSGRAFVAMHGARWILVESITMRGTLGAAGRAALRDVWIARRVRELGL